MASLNQIEKRKKELDKKILQLHSEGLRYKVIQERLGISKNRICLVLKRKRGEGE